MADYGNRWNGLKPKATAVVIIVISKGITDSIFTRVSFKNLMKIIDKEVLECKYKNISKFHRTNVGSAYNHLLVVQLK